LSKWHCIWQEQIPDVEIGQQMFFRFQLIGLEISPVFFSPFVFFDDM